MTIKCITVTVAAFCMFFAAAVSSLPANAQDFENTVFQLGEPSGIGARALGMGGAFIAISDDYSAVHWNPAGLAQIRYNQFYGSLSHLVTKQEATFLGNSTTGEASYTRLNSIGLVFPIPTYQGSLVFAGGYNRVQSFDAHREFFWINPLTSGEVSQDFTLHTAGGLNNWSFSGAMAFSPEFIAGATLSFWDGREDYELSFIERDYLDFYSFDSYDTQDNIITQYTAFNAKLGGLYRLGKHLRIGATIATPMTFTAKEEWSYDAVEIFDNDSTTEDYDSGYFDYKISSPFAFGLGAALSVGNLTVSGDVEYQDWSQIRYKTEPPTNQTKSEANREIQKHLRATSILRAGAELTIPFLGSQVRGGYVYDPSPYKDALPEHDRQYFSLGASFLLDSNVRLDVTWIRGWWEHASNGFSDEVYMIDEKVTRDKILSTVVIKF